MRSDRSARPGWNPGDREHRPSSALTLRLPLAAAALLVLSAFAFWPQYLSRLGAADGYTHAHAALGTCWLLLLIVQPWLVRRRARRRHRLLGRLGGLAGAAFFVTGVLVAHRSLVRLNPEQLAREGGYVYLPLSMAALFGAALLLGILWRSVPPVHGRFMAATALPLLDPLFARILDFYFPPLPALFLYQVPAFTLATAVLAGLAVTLREPARGRRAFGLFAAGSVAVLLLFFVVPESATWFRFVLWFRSLPLT